MESTANNAHQQQKQPQQPQPKQSSSAWSSAGAGTNQPSIQSFKVATQHGDMLIIRQGVTHHHHHHHQRHNHNQSQSTQHTPTKSTQAAIHTQHQHHHHHHLVDNASRPIIMTFHDLGLNSELQFAKFCQCDQVKLMLQTFTLIHVNFIGQECGPLNVANWTRQAGANEQSDSTPSINNVSEVSQTADNTLPEKFKYPSVDQLAECIIDVCAQLHIRSFIGLAVGAGAYIVCSLALVRPDLVDGLFLINPVMTRCSITEWLYFKISALSGHHNEKQQQHTPPPTAADSPSHEHGQGHAHPRPHGPPPNEKPISSTGQQRHLGAASTHSTQPSGRNAFMKLLSNPHFHLTHHFNKHEKDNPNVTNASSLTGSQQSVGMPTKSGSSVSVEQAQTSHVQHYQQQPHHHSMQHLQSAPTAGASTTNSSRLRWQILSKNFRNQVQQHRERQAHMSESNATLDGSATDLASLGEAGEGGVDDGGVSHERSGSSGHVATISNEKVPMEYLMYHHFGPGTFQRAGRRPSDVAGHSSNADSADEASGGGGAGRTGRHDSTGSNASSHKGSPVALGHLKLTKEAKKTRAGSESDQSVEEIVPANSEDQIKAASAAKVHDCGKSSHPSRFVRATSAGQHSQQLANVTQHKQQQRSKRLASVNLNLNFLSSLTNERQKLSYVQSVYRAHFEQMNAHNLWLFAQSFVKRKTLKLRKDCGAAAHAAAAAAALGTSVSMMRLQQDRAAAAEQAATADSANIANSANITNSANSSNNNSEPGTPNPADQAGDSQNHSHQVAGTKVKKTFACQTLIMCSNIQIHADRAFKMMSMLNPLQASCIKSEHFLVLEERPDKVCQALRLFLQGIGYSMSTYERRLKMSSMQAGAGSNESRDSISSLN